MKLIKWTEQVHDRLKWKAIVEKAKTLRVVVKKKKKTKKKKKKKKNVVDLGSRDGVECQSCHYWPEIAALTNQSGKKYCHGEANLCL
jgi:hypothetical protein